MNKRFIKLLAWFAQRIIAKYQPLVIGVTGSIGKTSTRHAIAAVLSAKYTVREPEKNFNNEIGIPLTVIGARGLDEGGGMLGWLRIFAKAARVLWLPYNYPKVAVLEYGIDHPGDMDALLKIVQPKIAVLTTIGISHREFFNTEAEIAHEKGKIVAGLPEDGAYIYNADDPHVVDQASRTKAQLLSYAVENKAEVKVEKIEEQLALPPRTRLTVQTLKRNVMVSVSVVGAAHVSAITAAVAVAEHLEMETDLILKGLSNYKAVPSRLNVIAGIKHTIIIDDTYNAAPLSTTEALNLLMRFPASYKTAVLGDMLELGDLTKPSHERIGQVVGEMNLDLLVTVGKFGKIIADAAIAFGMSKESVHSFATSDQARKAVQTMLVPDSVILIKGSQGARMEKITKEIMAEPMRAGELLCRQYGKWME